MKLLLCISILALPLAAAETVVEFWHSQDATEDLIQIFADEFNARQNEFRVVPRYVGSYPEGAIKLVAALNSGDVPTLFDAELTVFVRLIEEEALADLSPLTAALPEELVADFYPILWDYGAFDGARFGLPWHMSMPVLFYNATVFSQLGLEVPRSWEAFEAAAARLTTRNTRGYLDVAYSLIFETMVTTRGGRLVTDHGLPAFDSPEALDALEMLARLARERHSLSRSLEETDQALVDFARTKVMMAITSQAFFPQGERFSVAFDVAAAPIPGGEDHAVPLTGAQLVILRDTTPAERDGAFAFWRYLVETDTIERWVRESYFLPVRHSALEGLEPWYQEDASRRASLVQLDQAVFRPRSGAYAIWQQYLEEGIERVTKAGADPRTVLEEVQRRAMETR